MLYPQQRGIPTATVGINNSTNAALLAIRILGISLPGFQERMVKFQHDLEANVLQKREQLKTMGVTEYIAKVINKST